jgi:hypothetical protein
MSELKASEQEQVESLRNLYFSRTVVQLLWAAVVIATAATNAGLAAGLLIAYPLWDVACTVYDLRSSGRSQAGPPAAQYVNAVLGTLAAIGIALTAFKTPQHAVVVFGAWALAAGLAQLAVGITRRRQMGGQWAMILSGLQSAVAGVAFIVGGLHDTKHIKDLGGYAVFGGVYFLIAGILMHRRLSRSVGVAAAIESKR